MKRGSGKLRIRAGLEIEDVKGGKQQIVITEIPYTMIRAGIGKFLNDTAQRRVACTNDISDISNQSSKEGIGSSLN